MINLLSHEVQQRNRAARLNLKLRGYVISLVAVLFSVTGLFGAGYYLTLQERTAAESKLAKDREEASTYQSVRTEAEAFAANLKIAKAILSQETLYSDLITQYAQALPPISVLTALNLGETTATPTTQLQLNARVKTKADALVLKNTLEASPLFENVNINSVTEETPSNIEGPRENRITRDFPVVVIISVTQSKPVKAAS